MPKQAVKVIIRTRPTANFASKNLVIDQAKGQMQIMLDKDEAHGSVNNMTDLYKFNFEKILHNASQDETYEASASEIIQSVVDGYNGTVLCYGQTGAGKTYTMTGSATQFKYRGIIPRALNQIYALTSARFDQAVTVRISYAEIYNERIRDLIPEKDGYSKADLSQ
jgi:kinesin family protein 6/9